MAEIFSYNFDDGPTLDPLKKFWHFNQLQGPGPIYGDLLDQFTGYGWIYVGGSPLGASRTNSELQTFSLYDRLPGTADYSAKVQVKFGSWTVVDRWFDLVARAHITDEESSGGWSGYVARLRTNFASYPGTKPYVQLFRVVDGVYTEIDKADIEDTPTGPGYTDDHWGDYLKIRVSGNRVWVYWQDWEAIDHTEADADLIYGDYGVGFAAAGGQAPNGAAIRDLVVEDTSDSAGITGRFILRVGDDYYGQDEMGANGISLQNLTVTYGAPAGFSVVVNELHTNPMWRPNQYVELKAWIAETSEYKVVFRGRMKTVKRIGQPPQERVDYFAIGPRDGLRYVWPEHPTTEAANITWNALENEEGYESAFADKKIGEIIQWYYDEFADELSAAYAVDPDPYAIPYISAELAALDMKPTRIQLGGTFESILNGLLQMIPNIAFYVDMLTWKHRFIDVTAISTNYDLEYTDGDHIPVNQINDDWTNVWTAGWIKSTRVEEVDDEATTQDGSLERLWDRRLENDWSPTKSQRSSAVYTVESVTTINATTIEITVKGAKLFAWEWNDCVLRIVTGRGSPDTVAIEYNSNVMIRCVKTAGWTPSLLPQSGDTVRAEDARVNSEATEQNGFSYVFRRFRIKDESKRDLTKNSCQKLTMSRRAGNTQQEVVGTPTYLPGSGIVMSGITIASFIPNRGMCDNAGQYEAAEAKFEFRWKEVEVRKLRYPSAGYTGTGFSEDQSKWGVSGASPLPADWGIQRLYIIRDDEWGDDTENTSRDKALRAFVDAHCNKPYRGTTEIKALDWRFAWLSVSVTFSTTSTLRSGSTGMESAYIVPFTVEYTFFDGTTRLELGDSGMLARSFDSMKKIQSDDNRSSIMHDMMKRMEEFQKCIERNEQPKTGGQDAGASTCGTSVRGGPVGGGGGGKVGPPGPPGPIGPTGADGTDANKEAGTGETTGEGGGSKDTGSTEEGGTSDPKGTGGTPSATDDPGKMPPGGGNITDPRGDTPLDGRPEQDKGEEGGYTPGGESHPSEIPLGGIVAQGGFMQERGDSDNDPTFSQMEVYGANDDAPDGVHLRNANFKLYARRAGSGDQEEWSTVARSSKDGTRPSAGRDRGMSETGRGEIPVSPNRHQHKSEQHPGSPGQAAFPNAFSSTPLSGTEGIVLRDQTTGVSEALVLGLDYTVSGDTVTLLIAPTAPFTLLVDYETQGNRVRRSERLQWELGHTVQYTGGLVFELLVVAETLILDHFTDSNGTGLDAHTPDTDVAGTGWTETVGQWEIQSNQARATGSVPGDVCRWLLLADQNVADDFTAEVDFVCNNNASYAGLVFRASDSQNFWIVMLRADSNVIYVNKLEGNSWAGSLASASVTIDPGNTYNVRVEVDGTLLKVYLDDSLEIEYPMSSFNQSAEGIGLRALTVADYYFDNFKIVG